MNQQELWVILDLRGCILHSYHRGSDPESGSSDRQIKTPGHTLSNFLEQYLLPSADLVPLNRIICVNDAGKLYRKSLYPEYKANRKPMEPAVQEAVEQSTEAVRQVLHSLGIVQCSVPHTEADDVIAYLTQRLPGYKLIHTVDGDLTALASDTVTVHIKGHPQDCYECDGIQVLPRHVTLFKAIVGDTSDNIKGVPGMGPKSWLSLIKEFGQDGMDQLTELLEQEDIGRIQSLSDELNSANFSKLAAYVNDLRRSYQFDRICQELFY
jgi:5'-3' exonuclease